MRLLPPILLALLAGCATVLTTLQLDERFGPADPGRFDRPPAASAAAPDYWKEVRPVLDQRCVSCHACYDAPCQLNLTSYAGLIRGANPKQVYATRLTADTPTRLGFDALSAHEWRARDFFPVLNERAQTPEANRTGVMFQMLALKRGQPGPSSGPLLDKDLDFSLDREQTCPQAESMAHYARQHPGRGMPFGLPALSASEHETLANWLTAGAPYTPPPPPASAVTTQIADWEAFLNAPDRRSQLVARYIYEHWFVGQFHFPEQPALNFDLVRSRTPPGQPIEVTATRHPYDDPGPGPIHYRLRRLEATPVAKTFMPIELNPRRLARLRGWFAGDPVAELPGYDPATTANPFVTFKALPVDARYRFMLDEAQFTMAGFMKGPVCRGQVALNVINDHFWIVFQAPGERASQQTARLIEAGAPNLALPNEHESAGGMLAWRSYAEKEKAYLATKHETFKRLGEAGYRPTVAGLWDGDGHNPNAALTIFRHFDSASIMRGLVGERPQTALLLSYPLLERMHYLLVAGFDVYGNVGHQLATRLYMDFLRMEGELNFLALLPVGHRQKALDHWYRGRSAEQDEHLAKVSAYFPVASGEKYRTNDPLDELYKKVATRVAKVREQSLDWRGSGLSAGEQEQMRRLSQIRGTAISHLPEMSLLVLQAPGALPHLVTLIANSAHSNVAQLFQEEKRRLPDEDTLLAVNGVAGANPNAIYAVTTETLPAFVTAVSRLAGPDDLIALNERFAVRRTDPRFWPTSDAIHAAWRAMDPSQAAVLDYSRLDHR